MPSVTETNSNSSNHSLIELKRVSCNQEAEKTDVDRSEGNRVGTGEDDVDAANAANGTRNRRRKRKKKRSRTATNQTQL